MVTYPVSVQARTALPCDPQSVRAARHFVSDALRDWGQTEQLVDTAELLVSELVSNALLHAHSSVEVVLRYAEDTTRVEVSDTSGRDVVRRRHSLSATTGRGLMLVDQLAAAWGVTRRRGGKIVWFEVRPGMAEPEPDLDAFLAFADGVA